MPVKTSQIERRIREQIRRVKGKERQKWEVKKKNGGVLEVGQETCKGEEK